MAGRGRWQSFDYSDRFNQQRVRLADIDGSGTTDILYLKCDGVNIYRKAVDIATGQNANATAVALAFP